MANVNIKFNNKDYLLSCDDGQEESLKKLTKFLDKKYSELQDKLGNIGENKLNIDKYGNTAGLIRGSKSEIKKRTAKTEFIINKNFSIIERFFISYLLV